MPDYKRIYAVTLHTGGRYFEIEAYTMDEAIRIAKDKVIDEIERSGSTAQAVRVVTES